ncbi:MULTISPECIES: MarR family winged helix-turn-helix transcriptional regulator [Streptomyces]|uniref:MarR family winged helix-turn-helix transcriptional regulator n=1 Tax=Streptomyces TaxID=1883 RepID=UPI00292D8D4D|nr:MarR family winged helix-turn-helix transcriptional regulator [Streptomyces sp. NEAU-HV9]
MTSDVLVTHVGGDGAAEGPGDGPEAVASDITAAVESLTALWAQAAQEAALRLSLHQLRALHAVESAPGVNLTALADRLDVALPAASRLCDRLEAAGLLQRALHPHKRREVQLGLTPQGRRVLADVAARRRRALAAALAAMEPAQRSALRRGMYAFLAAQQTPPRRPGGPDAR